MRREHPNFRHLRIFREVTRNGSISRTSTQVNLSQPALTRAIANLEAWLGTPLFDRRPGGMAPTAAGAAFLNRVQRALAVLRLGAREALRLAGVQRRGGFENFDELLTTAQLRALVAVAQAGNFSLAARAVGISQPALYRAARDVERLSGLALFARTARGIDLTPPAEALVRAVKLAFAELRQGYAEIDGMLGVDKGQIVVGTLPLPNTFVLPAAINAFQAERPDVRLNVIDGPYDDLLHGLRHGEIDLIVGSLREPAPIDDVVQETLFREPVSIVARIGHPLAGRRDIGLDDLAAYPWVIPREGTPTRAAFNALFEGRKGPSSLVESSSFVLVHGLLLESDRLTMISAHQVRREQRMGVIGPLPLDLSHTARPIGVAHRCDWQPTVTQERFLDCLRDAGRQVMAARNA